MSDQDLVADLHRVRRRSSRRRLSERLFPVYVGALIAAFVGVEIGGLGQFHVGSVGLAKSAAGHALSGAIGSIWLVLAALTVSWAAMSGIDGGPVALSGDDIVLLMWPVSRRQLVRRCLVRSWLRAAVAGLILGAFSLLAVVSGLSLRFDDMAACCLYLPPLIAATAVSISFLVQRRPALHPVVRFFGTGVIALVVIAAGLLYRTTDGTQTAWRRLADIGHDGPWWLLVKAGQPDVPAGSRLLSLAIVTALAGICMLLAWREADTFDAEELTRRSQFAQAIGNALFVGDTSTIYLTRRQMTRSRRTHRWNPGMGGQFGAVLSKSALQQQGVQIASRVIGAASLAVIVAAATHAGASVPSSKVSAVVAGFALTIVGSRYIDPVRLDLEQPAPIRGLPVALSLVGLADLFAPWALLSLGCAIAVPLAVALHVTTIRDGAIVFLLASVTGLIGIDAAAITAMTSRGFGADPYLSRASGPLLGASLVWLGAHSWHSDHAAGYAVLAAMTLVLTIASSYGIGSQLQSW